MTSTIEKATSIITEIDNHVSDNCEHCKELLKSAVGTNHSSRHTDDTIPEPPRNDSHVQVS